MFIRTVAIIFVMLSLFAGLAQTEERVTLTTYYPSPQGEYRQIRFYPTDDETTSCELGALYYRDSEHRMKYCAQGFKWRAFTPDLPPGTQCGMLYTAAGSPEIRYNCVVDGVSSDFDNPVASQRCPNPSDWEYVKFIEDIIISGITYNIKTCYKKN